uniref:Uncharacterized protein n=1 Tax=Romanomermis culicivorax TaxID=13658 RepID=A0A915KZK8_ROMCU
MCPYKPIVRLHSKNRDSRKRLENLSIGSSANDNLAKPFSISIVFIFGGLKKAKNRLIIS